MTLMALVNLVRSAECIQLLSTLISSLSLYHHLYADDTQLFLSCHPSDFQASITYLQNALTQITSWMTSNLLSLNSAKTEFLLIGHKRHAVEKDSQPLDFNKHYTRSASNLGFIFDEHLSFSDQISALSKSCYHYIRAIRCIRPYVNLHTAKMIATTCFTPSLEPASYITQNSSSKYYYSSPSQRPSFEHAGLTC